MAVILTDLSSLNSSVGPDPAQGSLLALLMKDETGWAWGWVSLLLLSPGLPQATLEDVLNPRRQRADPTPGTVAWWQCCQALQDSRTLVCQSCYLLHRADQLWLSWKDLIRYPLFSWAHSACLNFNFSRFYLVCAMLVMFCKKPFSFFQWMCTVAIYQIRRDLFSSFFNIF